MSKRKSKVPTWAWLLGGAVLLSGGKSEGIKAPSYALPEKKQDKPTTKDTTSVVNFLKNAIKIGDAIFGSPDEGKDKEIFEKKIANNKKALDEIKAATAKLKKQAEPAPEAKALPERNELQDAIETGDESQIRSAIRNGIARAGIGNEDQIFDAIQAEFEREEVIIWERQAEARLPIAEQQAEVIRQEIAAPSRNDVQDFISQGLIDAQTRLFLNDNEMSSRNAEIEEISMMDSAITATRNEAISSGTEFKDSDYDKLASWNGKYKDYESMTIERGALQRETDALNRANKSIQEEIAALTEAMAKQP